MKQIDFIGKKNFKALAGIAMGFLFLGFGCVFGFEFYGGEVFATTPTATLTVPGSVSLNVATGLDGTAIVKNEISVESTCRAGYNLKILTPGGSDLYKYENNAYANTATFSAVDSRYALGNTNNANKWGYTLTSSPNNNTTFYPLSTTGADIRTPAQTASQTDIDETVAVYFGINVADNVAVGKYKMANDSAIQYQMTMDPSCTSYTVSFDANGGSGTTMEPQRIEVGEATALVANTYSAPSGKVFAGWNTAADGSGTSYVNGEAVTDLTAAMTTITLYAQWGKHLQDVAGWRGSVGEGETVMAVDYRDNAGYTVTRINGRLWMTQNLRYLPTSGTTLYPGSTNVTSITTLSTVGDLSSGDSDSEPRVHYTNSATYGVWYNFAAASAETITGSGNTDLATQDICPAGWSLPRYDTNEDSDTINGLLSYKSAFNPVNGGKYNGGRTYSDSYGYWWSATEGGGAYRSVLQYDGLSLSTNSGVRYNGYYIRCVEKLYLQDIETWKDYLEVGETTTAYDNRDNKAYTVGKLADGRIWMLDNLALEINDSTVLNGMDALNTNATSATLASLQSTGVTANNSWTADSYMTPMVNTLSKDLTRANVTNPSDPMTEANAWKFGVFYNYCAATAGSYCSASNVSLGNATEDICPAGWSLPTGYSSGSIQALARLYNNGLPGTITNSTNYANFRTAFRLPIAGYVTNGSVSNRGELSGYWSNTGGSYSQYMYGLGVYAASVNPLGYASRSYGQGIRCVAKADYMQDVASWENSVGDGESVTVVDSRDGSAYSVTRIAGALWMTQNLRLITSASASQSNFTGANFDPCVGDLTAGDSYTEARCHVPTATDITTIETNTGIQYTHAQLGVWYNYAAASAGTITGSSNQTLATQDICPAGWHLPQDGTSTGQIGSITGYLSLFSPVTGGYYYNGAIDSNYSGNGYWWSATASRDDGRYYLYYNGSILGTGSYLGYRSDGVYLRCVRSS